MAVPYTFGTATASIPLSQLDSNFATVITLGNTAIQLGNTVTTLNNMTLANVTISSGNVTLTNVTITTANVTTANVVTLIVTGNETVQGNTTVTGTITGAKLIPTGSSVTGNGMYLPAANSVGISTNGTNAVYIDSTQNVGIGTSSPAYKLDVSGVARVGGLRQSFETGLYTVDGTLSNYSATNGVYLNGNAAGWLRLNGDGTGASYVQVNGSTASTSPNTIQLFTASTERMRLDSSGNLLVGTTSVGASNSNSWNVYTSNNAIVYQNHINGTGSGTGYTNFNYNGGVIGSITQSGTTAVLYNVTSDQRLKENIQDADSASALIDSLQVRQFDWKTDNTHQRYGFVAQELVTVAPEAVHQPTDTEEMMAVDYSKLVPMLVKEVQSLRKRLADAGIA